MDRETIELLTLAVRLFRQLKAMGIYDMPLELKGLKANMLKLQARVGRLNTLAAGADEKGAMLEGYLGDVASQIGAHVSDIEFAANVLGNSGSGSEAEKPKTDAKSPETEKITVTAAEVGELPPGTFQPTH